MSQALDGDKPRRKPVAQKETEEVVNHGERIEQLEAQRAADRDGISEIKTMLRDHIEHDTAVQESIDAKLDKIDLQTAYSSGGAAQRKQILVAIGGLVSAVISGGFIVKLFVMIGWSK
jgi:hypothetical protein